MKRALVASLFLFAGCATSDSHREAAPLFTRTALTSWTTSDLARHFLEPADAATVESHRIQEDTYLVTRDKSWEIWFDAPDRAVGPDICLRTTFRVDFFPIKRTAGNAGMDEIPARAQPPIRLSAFALAPACADLPGRRFAVVLRSSQNAISDSEAIAILRTLAAARAAAAGTGPLPFRLSCDNRSRRNFECPADLRSVLAALPLHQAFTIERNPFPNNCDTSAREQGDAVEIGGPHDNDIWDARLRDMGTAQAEVILIRQFPRTRVKC